jgi:PhoPQ-activated pathogenicity-related protein
MSSYRRLGAGLWLAALVGGLTGPAARAGLVEYVQKPDTAFKWELKGKTTQGAFTVYDLRLVSQVWEGITWEHQLQVYRPTEGSAGGTVFLWNTGGSASPGNQTFALQLAKRLRMPCAFLYHIPNQPLLDGKKEDALIAETFVRYLNTRDEDWPLLFPMVKSVVKAMDVVQALAKQEWKEPVKDFVVSGASKRGWTAWLTAAADPRVKAVAPAVIDTLNMRAQMPHQLESYGRYSDMIADYTRAGLVPMPDTPEAKRLWGMVDPWVYRDKLRLPKCIINGANDPYWTVDALNLYWDDLKGDKWVMYVPNAGHNLQQQTATGRDFGRALNGLTAFARHQATDRPLPRLRWKHDETDGKLRLTVTASPAPKGARLWVADAPTRDFRPAKWVEQAAQVEGETVTGLVDVPAKGCRAFFAELDYAIDDLPYHLSTQVRVAGTLAKSP